MADDNPTIEQLQARVAELEEQNATLEGELAKEKAKHATTKSKLKVAKAPKSDQARKVGAMRAPRNDEEADARRQAISDTIASGVTQVVFSDGKKELRELNPLNVGGDGWRATPHGHVLDDEPMLEPGDCQRTSFDLHGFGLLNGDGEQVAYHELPTPIKIERNRRYQLPAGSIRF